MRRSLAGSLTHTNPLSFLYGYVRREQYKAAQGRTILYVQVRILGEWFVLNQAIDGWHMGCRSWPLEDAKNVPDHTISLPGVPSHPGLRLRVVVSLAGPGLGFDGHSGRG